MMSSFQKTPLGFDFSIAQKDDILFCVSDYRSRKRKVEQLENERMILSNYNKKLVTNRQEMKKIHEKQFVILHSQIQR